MSKEVSKNVRVKNSVTNIKQPQCALYQLPQHRLTFLHQAVQMLRHGGRPVRQHVRGADGPGTEQHQIQRVHGPIHG